MSSEKRKSEDVPDPGSKAAADEGSEERADRVMRRVRHETSSKDLLTFSFGKMWSVLLVVVAGIVVIAEKFATAKSNDKSPPED